MDFGEIKFIDDIFGDLISTSAACTCEVKGDDIHIVTQRLVVIIVQPPD